MRIETRIETIVRALAFVLPAGVLTIDFLACGANQPDSTKAVDRVAAGYDAQVPNEGASLVDAGDQEGDDVVASAGDQEGDDVVTSDSEAVRETGTESEMPAASPRSFVRLANWTPDAPSLGFDVCLAPHGTTAWSQPLLTQNFASGTLGQGGPNGIQFPWVTEAVPVPPGQYDLEVVVAGSTDCTMGETMTPIVLPEFIEGARTLIATIGDLHPTDNDASFKVAVFPDALPVAGTRADLRVINTLPSIGYADIGVGSAANKNFAPLFTDVAFGTSGMNLAGGGAISLGGYGAIAPLSGAQFSARPSGMVQDTATASHVSLAAGSATTMVLVNGENGGVPPQFLVCTDTAQPTDSLTPCMVFAQ
jgi:hypothetical protein